MEGELPNDGETLLIYWCHMIAVSHSACLLFSEGISDVAESFTAVAVWTEVL